MAPDASIAAPAERCKCSATKTIASPPRVGQKSGHMLTIDNLSVRIAGRLLIDGATARVTEGSRIGLVGRNGTGKSTLFNVITGELAAEGGDIEIPPRWRIGRRCGRRDCRW